MPDTLSSDRTKRDTLQSALALIDACTDEKALFIGETITDEYRFVVPLSKPPKESVLAVRALGSESWPGGVTAARDHAKDFCQTGILTRPHNVRKIRYLEEYSARKLFEVQEIDDAVPLMNMPADILERYDVLAVHDYGHGMLPEKALSQLYGQGYYLAIAVQTNAANAGFNLITKYPAADYIVIDEPEARLAAGDRDSPIEDVMRRLAAGRCPRFVVTHGRHGAYALECGEFYSLPAMSDRVVDTMGAGDAFFAVTACMARLSPEFGGLCTLLAIGNAAGAVKCGILGHRAAVTKQAVIDVLKAKCA